MNRWDDSIGDLLDAERARPLAERAVTERALALFQAGAFGLGAAASAKTQMATGAGASVSKGTSVASFAQAVLHGKVVWFFIGAIGAGLLAVQAIPSVTRHEAHSSTNGGGASVQIVSPPGVDTFANNVAPGAPGSASTVMPEIATKRAPLPGSLQMSAGGRPKQRHTSHQTWRGEPRTGANETRHVDESAAVPRDSAKSGAAPNPSRPVTSEAESSNTAQPPNKVQPVRDVLAGERLLLDGARKSLGSGHPNEALERIEAHAREFPNGSLRQEREAIAVQALLSLGRRAEATERARRFKARYGSTIFDSILASAVESHE